MPRSKDPFSDIKLSDDVGLDQRLFQQDDDGTAKQRTTETTRQRDSASTEERANGATGQRDNQGARRRIRETTGERFGAAASRRLRERTRKPTPAVGIVIASERIDERHSHDIFRDQVRWMNRTKVDMEETYGKRITSNEIVKLALDLLIDDFKRHGESSKLIRTLILGEGTPARTHAGPAETGWEGDDG